jgi:hypothetical protein
MPDLQNFSVVTTGNVIQVGPTALTTIVEYLISGDVTDSTTGHLLSHFSFKVPEVFPTLTAVQLQQLMQIIARFLITTQTGY